MENFFTSLQGYRSAQRLSQSGSDRIYWRIRLENSSVIGVYGSNTAENRTFAAMADFFGRRGISVPKVLAVSEDGRCYIQEDLGDDTLRNRLDDVSLLKASLKELVRMQMAGRDFDYGLCFATKEFGPRIVAFDLNYFKYCFLKPYMKQFDENLLQDDLDRLQDDLLAVKGDTFLYRDFQSRNIMIKDGRPCFIDFQGGFRGPFYYDLCSFVFQASAGFSPERRADLIDTYYIYLGEYVHVGREEFDANVRLFALFRCLQTLGCYGFRGLTEHRQYFIDSIPAGLRNFKDLVPERYPYLKKIAYELDSNGI